MNYLSKESSVASISLAPLPLSQHWGEGAVPAFTLQPGGVLWGPCCLRPGLAS